MNSMDLRAARKVAEEFGLDAVEVKRKDVRQSIVEALAYADVDRTLGDAKAQRVREDMMALPGSHAMILFNSFSNLLPDGRVIGCPLNEVFGVSQAEAGWEVAFYTEFDRQMERLTGREGGGEQVVILTGRRA